MRLVHLVPFAVVLGLVTACGGSDTGGDDAAGVSLAELPKEYAAAFCEVFSELRRGLVRDFRPGEECLEAFTPSVAEALATLPHAVEIGTVKYHASKVQACLDDVTAGGCNTLSQREPASCKAALEGTVKEGGACTLDAECVGDQYCKLGDACPGECAPYEQAGGACSSDDNCVSGLKCGDNAHCVAPTPKGGDCSQGEPDCADGLLCLGEDSDAKTPGKCFTISEALSGKAGDACGLGDGKLCASGYACEIKSIAPVAGECVAKLRADAACHAAFPDECPDDQYCLLGANPLAGGTCTSKPSAGEKCGAGLGSATICAPYARCDDGVCRKLADAGETCSNDDTCYSGHCVGGACVTGSSCQ